MNILPLFNVNVNSEIKIRRKFSLLFSGQPEPQQASKQDTAVPVGDIGGVDQGRVRSENTAKRKKALDIYVYLD